MLELVVKEIEAQAAQYRKHSNQWNVAQQLIDILYDEPDQAGIVYEDLKVKEMSVGSLVQKITGKRIADPEKVMQEICKFYGIRTPDTLPPEHWRGDTPVRKQSLFDLMG